MPVFENLLDQTQPHNDNLESYDGDDHIEVFADTDKADNDNHLEVALSKKSLKSFENELKRLVHAKLDETLDINAIASSYVMLALHKSKQLRIIFLSGNKKAFKAYVHKACLNCVYNVTRSSKYKDMVKNTTYLEGHNDLYGDYGIANPYHLTESLGLPASPEDVLSYATQFEAKVRESELSSSEVSFLESRPPIQRTVFILSSYYNVKAQDIAELTGLTCAQVYSMWHQLKHAYRKHIQRYA